MGCQFAELDWGGLLNDRAEMYIVVVAFLALLVSLAPASSVSFVPALSVSLVLVPALSPRLPGSSLISFNGSESRLMRFPGSLLISFPGSYTYLLIYPVVWR